MTIEKSGCVGVIPSQALISLDEASNPDLATATGLDAAKARASSLDPETGLVKLA
jgi:hypothetical protein